MATKCKCSKKIKAALAELELIAGQKPVATKARKSIAGFKLREGMTIGAKVTLRRDQMFEFLDRLTTIALPRVKDFRGLNGKSFDGNGNFAMGVKEHIVFPEINYDQVETIRGMDIIVCTTATTNEEAKALLSECGTWRRKAQLKRTKSVRSWWPNMRPSGQCLKRLQ